jgi:hypothetical protein
MWLVREAVAAGIFRVGKEDGETNLADLLMKVITGQSEEMGLLLLFLLLNWSNSQQASSTSGTLQPYYLPCRSKKRSEAI